MITFHRQYHPITSRPYLSSNTYQEYPASELLRPFIACYWLSKEDSKSLPNNQSSVLVIPDTCLDIIMRINYTKQIITGNFVGICDQSFIAKNQNSEDEIISFGIRFHFWAAHLFLNLDFKDAQNNRIELEILGREWMPLFAPILSTKAPVAQIKQIETFLFKKLNDGKTEIDSNLFNTIKYLIDHPQNSTIKEICNQSNISQRQIQRLFLQKIGLPPKRVHSLIRYQHVWNRIAFLQNYSVQDAVFQYGYTDQAHLIREFKRFHSVTPQLAKEIAINNA